MAFIQDNSQSPFEPVASIKFSNYIYHNIHKADDSFLVYTYNKILENYEIMSRKYGLENILVTSHIYTSCPAYTFEELLQFLPTRISYKGKECRFVFNVRSNHLGYKGIKQVKFKKRSKANAAAILIIELYKMGLINKISN